MVFSKIEYENFIYITSYGKLLLKIKETYVTTFWDDLLHIENIQLYRDEQFFSWYNSLSYICANWILEWSKRQKQNTEKH